MIAGLSLAQGKGAPNAMTAADGSPRLRRRTEAMIPSMLDKKGTKILAKSLFKELRANGYATNQILGLTTELIDLVTQDLRDAAAVNSAQVADVQPEQRATA
jgi:hypothetical protein